MRTAPTLAWTGRLTLPVRLMVDASNLIAWANGAAADTRAMKAHVRSGYEAAVSDHVARYDELGEAHYRRITDALLQRVDLRGRRVLDVGCGTGILMLRTLERGATSVVGVALAAHMLWECRRKAAIAGPARHVGLCQGDAEALPFESGSFDVVLCSMVLGLVPDQARLVEEMARLVRPGGVLALATHGPEHYWEAIDAAFRAAPKRDVLGYRIELWPRDEKEIGKLLRRAGLSHPNTQRLGWQDTFASALDLYDFFAATSASWWLAAVLGDRVEHVDQSMRRGFARRRLTRLTMDVVLAYALKPA